MKIIVFGKRGQLASSISKIAKSYPNFNIQYVAKDDYVIESEESVENIFKENFDLAINCSAYTKVDDAEDNYHEAFLVNVIGAKNIAKAASLHDVPLIHISTDFVFDGKGNVAYHESSKTNPLSVYGQTKLEGEQVIKNLHPKSIIIRTSWVFSEFGENFVKTMYRVGKLKKSLEIISDQVGCPTYAGSIAKIILDLALKIDNKFDYWGTYNFSGNEEMSWYKFATLIFNKIGEVYENYPIPEIKKVRTKDYKTKAVRPKFSVLCNSKIENLINFNRRPLEENLLITLSNLD